MGGRPPGSHGGAPQALKTEPAPSRWHEGSIFLGGHTESMPLRFLDFVPFKPDSPYSTALLRHYVERSGTPYDLGEIPEVWQKWIFKQTGGHVGTYKDLSPYNAGIYDLQNSLGHFSVRVTAGDNHLRIYELTDTYEFGFTPHDRRQQGRHGFPLGHLSPFELESIRRLLPKTICRNPGG